MELSKILIERIKAMKGDCKRAVSFAEIGDSEEADGQLSKAKLELDTVYQMIAFPCAVSGRDIPKEGKKLIEEVSLIYTQSFKTVIRSLKEYEEKILN